jgi:LmbE family N-acetylglucosaminyl deacetylase
MVTPESREALARILREHAPEIVLAQHTEDLHPDHAATGRLAREAWYLSGLARLAQLDGGPPAHRPRRFYHFMGHVPFEPTLVVDIEPVWEDKLRLVRCYASQLAPFGPDEPGSTSCSAPTSSAHGDRARFYGERIGGRVGEPLLALGPLPVHDPLRLL